MAQDDRTAKPADAARNAASTADGELSDAQLAKVAGGSGEIVTNLANMRHEMLKAVANNLRS